MSHYTMMTTQMVDDAALVAALADVGFPQVACFATPQPLVGYRGDVRPDVAHIIIRREVISSLSNDVGFVRAEDGRYHAIISDYDRQRFSAAWLHRLHQRYAYHATIATLSAQGFTLAEETQHDGAIHLVLQRS